MEAALAQRAHEPVAAAAAPALALSVPAAFGAAPHAAVPRQGTPAAAAAEPGAAPTAAAHALSPLLSWERRDSAWGRGVGYSEGGGGDGMRGWGREVGPEGGGTGSKEGGQDPENGTQTVGEGIHGMRPKEADLKNGNGTNGARKGTGPRGWDPKGRDGTYGTGVAPVGWDSGGGDGTPRTGHPTDGTPRGTAAPPVPLPTSARQPLVPLARPLLALAVAAAQPGGAPTRPTDAASPPAAGGGRAVLGPAAPAPLLLRPFALAAVAAAAIGAPGGGGFRVTPRPPPAHPTALTP